MIHIYDGNNVLLRELTNTFGTMAPRGMNIRYLYQQNIDPSAIRIWVFDGARHNQRRRNLYPDYKMNRSPLGEDLYASIGLWKELLPMTAAHLVEVPLWEADDVIASLARRFSTKGQAVVIHTNDLDYAQLMDIPYVTLNGVKLPNFPAKYVPLYKTFQGDASDNIPGVTGFGEKSWELMRPHWDAMLRALQTDDPDTLLTLPWPSRIDRRMKLFFSERENFELCKTFLRITQFIPVEQHVIDQHWVVGRADPNAAETLLRKFLL